MTTPHLVLRRPAAALRPDRLAPALAFPVLVLGLLLSCLGYLAVGVLLLRWVLGLG